ncbi:CubicO group peptidase (beta-lactamase class C family) [Chitinophaga dinghuensis]|uniref:CubicO group peptidase (Beta-lactamase class C family) n=1 Tax=Chitinophaga dinghuensis TaxID=1539050 RepID=A0A327WG26_9BACT|nr:serine hydrolase domain-containing protein [Chitinophaga dinghuensis]RAJ88280.1 CubicO group peptidase (beta-lactamase class C family) [Chitinophaga dinghuensis]
MRHLIRFAAMLVAVCCISCLLFGQKKDNYSAIIDSLIKAVHPRSFNGVVFIQQNGKIKYAKSYGYADFNKKTPLKITAGFSTMSIAKQFTATLILMEVEKGNLDLHTPIRKYLPDFKYSWADTVTLHHLLNNTSGLTSESLDNPLKFPVGTAFSYSNVGYSLLGQILEKQTHQTFDQLVTALFKKCGMHHSYYPSANSQPYITKGHCVKTDGTVTVNQKISLQPAQYFSSHLIVTAPDLAKWNEQLHNGKLLKPATYQLMTSYVITAQHPLFSAYPIGYGYGLRINDKAAIKEFGHTGFHPAEGFTAVNLYYPKSNTSVVVMENQANENFDIAYFFEEAVRKIVLTSDLLK